MIRVLFWKEWREGRALLSVSVLFMAALSCFYPVGDHISHILVPLPLMFVGSLLGAQAFSREAERFVFLLSKPVKKQRVMTVKLISGLLGIVLIVIVTACTAWAIGVHKMPLPLAEFSKLTHHTYYSGGQLVFYSLPLLFLSYALSFFMSSLLLNASTSLLIGFFGGLYINIPVSAVLKRLDCVKIYPIPLAVLCLVFLVLSFVIFAHREIRA